MRSSHPETASTRLKTAHKSLSPWKIARPSGKTTACRSREAAELRLLWAGDEDGVSFDGGVRSHTTHQHFRSMSVGPRGQRRGAPGYGETGISSVVPSASKNGRLRSRLCARLLVRQAAMLMRSRSRTLIDVCPGSY